MKNALNLILDFFRAGTDASSKRLTMVLSYLVCLTLCIIAVTFHVPIEGNVVTLLLGCCGVSTTGYVMTNKNEVKNIDAKDEG
jgi:hypothetical protein